MYSYSGDPSATDLDKVRFLLSDTNSTSPLLQDEEIYWLLEEWSNAYEAAASGAEIIAGQYAHKSDYSKSVGDLSLSQNFDTQANRFRSLAVTLRGHKYRKEPPTWVVNEAVLESTANRVVDIQNSDFYSGQFDNPSAST